jgi:hypothetical protein
MLEEKYNMQLTRHVLIEKENLFAKYHHPYDVPEEAWKKTHLKFRDNNFKNLAEYIAKEIMSPICGTSNYVITGNRGLNDENRKTTVFFENLFEFKFSLMLIKEMLMEENHKSFKGYVLTIWRNKTKFNK